jgi:hypothetical protein
VPRGGERGKKRKGEKRSPKAKALFLQSDALPLSYKRKDLTFQSVKIVNLQRPPGIEPGTFRSLQVRILLRRLSNE